MKAIEFLRDVVDSIGCFASPDDEVLYLVPSSESEYVSKPLVSKSGYPYLIPTNANIKKLMVLEDDKAVLKCLPFNPITEDDIRLKTECFSSLVAQCRSRMMIEFFETGILLINLIQNDKAVKKKDVKLERFLLSVNKVLTTKNTKPVDETTFKHWTNVIKNSTQEGIGIINCNVKRGGVYNGEEYNSLATIDFPIYKDIMDLDTEENNSIHGVKLRNKDIVLFKEIFQLLLPDLEDDNTYRKGSNHVDYPAFISFFSLYLKVMENFRKISSQLDCLDKTDKILRFELKVKSEDIAKNLKEIHKELCRIPTEKSLLEPEVRKEEEEEIQEHNLPIGKNAPTQKPNIRHVPHEPRKETTGEDPDRAIARMFSRGPSTSSGYGNPYAVAYGNTGNGSMSDVINSAAMGGNNMVPDYDRRSYAVAYGQPSQPNYYPAQPGYGYPNSGYPMAQPAMTPPPNYGGYGYQPPVQPYPGTGYPAPGYGAPEQMAPGGLDLPKGLRTNTERPF